MFNGLAAWLQIGAMVTLLVIGGVVGKAIGEHGHAQIDEKQLAQFRTQKKLNDSTSVILVGKDVKIRELEGLVSASKQLNGKLVAAIKLTVKADTARGTVQTTETLSAVPDSARFFAFRDSTTTGVLQGSVRVPPAPTPATVSYTFAPNALTPSVGFVRVGSKYVAVVTCSTCVESRIEVPVVDTKAIVPPAPRVSKWLAIGYDPIDLRWGSQAGLDLRLFGGLAATAQASRSFAPNSATHVFLGAVKQF